MQGHRVRRRHVAHEVPSYLLGGPLSLASHYQGPLALTLAAVPADTGVRVCVHVCVRAHNWLLPVRVPWLILQQTGLFGERFRQVAAH